MRALFLVALLAAGAARAEAPIPPLTGPVVDTANLLGAADVARLEALARAARAVEGGHGVQLQYLVVPSLDGDDIASYSIRVAERWQLGDPDRDNGVLVTVAVQDRQARIEVGNGIEGGLTDVQSSRIIRSVLAPAFQQGRYGEGLYQTGVQILGALGALPKNVAPAQRLARRQTHVPALGIVAIFVIMMILRAFTGFGGRRRRSMWWGGGPFIGGGWGGGGGGFGGFGGGGGGWSGGGGGFSGGGASGRW